MSFLYENLDVYKKSIQLADELTEATELFPKGKYYLKDQLNRACISIFLNIAEGNGRFHTKDKMHFFYISRGSACECAALVDMCLRKQLVEEKKAVEYRQRLNDICRMLSGLINRFKE